MIILITCIRFILMYKTMCRHVFKRELTKDGLVEQEHDEKQVGKLLP